jgi:hypothetical protein
MLAYGEKSLEILKLFRDWRRAISPSPAALSPLPPRKEPMVLTDEGAVLGPRDSLGVLEEREMP